MFLAFVQFMKTVMTWRECSEPEKWNKAWNLLPISDRSGGFRFCVLMSTVMVARDRVDCSWFARQMLLSTPSEHCSLIPTLLSELVPQTRMPDVIRKSISYIALYPICQTLPTAVFTGVSFIIDFKHLKIYYLLFKFVCVYYLYWFFVCSINIAVYCIIYIIQLRLVEETCNMVMQSLIFFLLTHTFHQ